MDDSRVEDENGTFCSICTFSTSLNNESEARLSVLACGHMFCLECVEEWVEKSQTCPNCKDKSDTVVKMIIPKGVTEIRVKENYDSIRYQNEIESLR